MAVFFIGALTKGKESMPVCRVATRILAELLAHEQHAATELERWTR